MSLTVLCPSRGRPSNAARLTKAFYETAVDDTTELVFLLDADDPTLNEYEAQYGLSAAYYHVEQERRRIGPYLNEMVKKDDGFTTQWGFMGDDHVPRTRGWDEVISSELNQLGTGVVYGNDLFQRENCATAWFMTRDITDTLGYMYPPGVLHMEGDLAVMDWGRAIGKLRYLPNVVIEHLHYLAEKAPLDDSYTQTTALLGRDRLAYEIYKRNRQPSDIEKLKKLIEVTA